MQTYHCKNCHSTKFYLTKNGKVICAGEWNTCWQGIKLRNACKREIKSLVVSKKDGDVVKRETHQS